MHIMKTCVLVFLTLLSSSSFSRDFSADDIVGFWLTKEKRAVIEVYKNGNKYEGKLVWLIDLHTGKRKEILDDKNPDEKLQKRKLLGLINLSGFKFEDNEWVDGNIYDPKKGKTYSAKMKLENKNELHLRGYIGVPMFGRTSVWTRESSAIPSAFNKR